ncbi:hypothetical protein WMY93_023679 [Mugilogobius chulae]|uniref:Fibronectin type-III domain-containing protein n=1 Tax=Mugilogobius chulae TaxID=88201 RepID=A0AAW0N617_9GOBI
MQMVARFASRKNSVKVTSEALLCGMLAPPPTPAPVSVTTMLQIYMVPKSLQSPSVCLCLGARRVEISQISLIAASNTTSAPTTTTTTSAPTTTTTTSAPTTTTTTSAPTTTNAPTTEATTISRPGSVTSLTVTEVTTSSLNLTWIQPPGSVSSYKVTWIGGSENGNKNTSQTTIHIPNLTPGVEYTVTVTAVAGDGLTEGAGVQISNYTKGLLSFYTVHWTDGNDSRTDNVTDTVKVITDLTPGVKYTITITAVAGDGQTDGAGVSISQYTEPGSVTSPTVTEVTTSSLNLTWIQPPGSVSSYKVTWSGGSKNGTENTNQPTIHIPNLTPGVEYTVTVTAVAGDGLTEGAGSTGPDGNDSRTDNVTDTVKVITDLTPGVKYTITITAVAGDGQTEGAGVTINLYTKPGSVTSPTVTEVTTSSLNLTWIQPPGSVSSYKVTWSGGSKNGTENTNQPTIHIPNLTPGVEYTVTVTAVAGDGLTEGAGVQISNIQVIHWTDGNDSRIDNVTDTVKVITDLTPGVKYTITITAVAGDGQTEGAGVT